MRYRSFYTFVSFCLLTTGLHAGTYPECRDAADNGRGYGDSFLCTKTSYCRKINDNWSENDNRKFWCTWQPDLIEHDGEQKFWSGINLGNVNFMPFSKAPYEFDLSPYSSALPASERKRLAVQSLLRKALKNLADHGTNSIRFWLHIDGSLSPSFSADPNDAGKQVVSGLEPELIHDLKWLLRESYKNGIYVNISLWSHDILAVRRLNPQQNRDRAVRMITDPAATDAYIQNALQPLLLAMKDCLTDCRDGKDFHDAVLSWEVLNEPEGVSWDWRLYHNYQYNLGQGTYYYYNPSAYDAQREYREVDYRSATYLKSQANNSLGVPYGGGFLHDCNEGDQCAQDSWRQGQEYFAKFDGHYFTSGEPGNLYFNEYMYHDVTNKYNSEYSFLLDQILNHGLQTVEVPLNNVLRFINRVAGTIHRVVPDAKVSVGAHSMPYTTDTPAIKGKIDHFESQPQNYYSDASLIAAGGDPLGTLDFYHAHGYPEWSDPEDKITRLISPFFQNKDFWELDKPLIVGEYWNLITGSHQRLKADDLIHLYYNNYAGAWGWAYFEVAEEPFNPGKPNKVVRTIRPHEMQKEFLPLLKKSKEALGTIIHTKK
ncbi:MAG: hypothetical protein ACOH5I_12600 [Oligoflexus sp.]